MDEIPLWLPSVWLIPETKQQKSDEMVMQKDDNPPIWTIHCRSTDLGHHPKIAAHFWPFALLLFSYRPVALRVELRGFLLSVQAQQINKRQWDGMGS